MFFHRDSKPSDVSCARITITKPTGALEPLDKVTDISRGRCMAVMKALSVAHADRFPTAWVQAMEHTYNTRRKEKARREAREKPPNSAQTKPNEASKINPNGI